MLAFEVDNKLDIPLVKLLVLTLLDNPVSVDVPQLRLREVLATVDRLSCLCLHHACFLVWAVAFSGSVAN